MNNKQRQTAYNDKQQTMTKDKPQITTNDSCKWSSEGAGLLQMIIRRGRPLANVYTEGPASCKWSYGGAGLLQMIIRRGRPLANDHLEEPASCKWSYGGASLSNTLLHPSNTSGKNIFSIYGLPAGLVNDAHHLLCVEHAVCALPIRYVEDSHLLWSRRAWGVVMVTAA